MTRLGYVGWYYYYYCMAEYVFAVHCPSSNNFPFLSPVLPGFQSENRIVEGRGRGSCKIFEDSWGGKLCLVVIHQALQLERANKAYCMKAIIDDLGCRTRKGLFSRGESDHKRLQ